MCSLLEHTVVISAIQKVIPYGKVFLSVPFVISATVCKHYGFSLNVDGSNTIRVFEGAIDLMSFYDVTGLTSDHLLALGMTDDKPLERYLSERDGITAIYLCLDNDEPGRKAAERIEKKYLDKGYKVKNIGSPKGFKDFNEWLVAKSGIDGKNDVVLRSAPSKMTAVR